MFLSNVLHSALISTYHQVGKIPNVSWQTQVSLIVAVAAVVLTTSIRYCHARPAREIKKQPDALGGLGDAPDLMAFLAHLTQSPVQRQKLQQRIKPSQKVDNLLVLEEMLRPFGADSKAALACKDLDRLMSQALQEQLKGMPQEGRAILEQTQTLVGKEFPLPLAGKLALVASLYGPQFQKAYGSLVEAFQKSQKQILQGQPMDDAASQGWRIHLTPLITDAPQKNKSVRLLENLLMAKAGMGEPLVFAENLPAIAMSLEELRADHRLGRPIHARDSALNILARYTSEEQQMLKMEGFSPNVQLGCFDFFTCERSKFSDCLFTFGYALPGLGTVTAQLKLALQGFEDQDPMTVMRFIKECLDTNLTGIDKVIVRNQAFLDKLGETRKGQLIENSRRLKTESDRLLKAAYMALGNSSIPLPLELKIA